MTENQNEQGLEDQTDAAGPTGPDAPEADPASPEAIENDPSANPQDEGLKDRKGG